jgi:hypothetical protein
MRSEPEFDFINDLPRWRHQLTGAERAGLIRLGLKQEDVDAIEHVLPLVPDKDGRRSKVQRAVTEALLHFRRHGKKILAGLDVCFDEILGRDFPETVGADTLFGKARGDVQGFGVTNDYRAFYTRILAARRPIGEVARLSFNSSWADLLIVAQWPPITTGEDE